MTERGPFDWDSILQTPSKDWEMHAPVVLDTVVNSEKQVVEVKYARLTPVSKALRPGYLKESGADVVTLEYEVSGNVTGQSISKIPVEDIKKEQWLDDSMGETHHLLFVGYTSDEKHSQRKWKNF